MLNVNYSFIFKSYHLKYFNKGIVLFLLKLKKELRFAEFQRILRLPKATKKITLLKAPSINKTAREQFELNTFKLKLILNFKVRSNEFSIIDDYLKNIVIGKNLSLFTVVKVKKIINV
jgi:hypothetical protein